MTHDEKVLRLLSDGLPHSHHELYGLHVIAHSRVASLRKKGHNIAAWRERDVYLYQLLLNEPSATDDGTRVLPCSDAGVADGSLSSSPVADLGDRALPCLPDIVGELEPGCAQLSFLQVAAA